MTTTANLGLQKPSETDTLRASLAAFNANADVLDALFACHPNLLDNWYFPRPVNQREAAGYTEDGYGIDRWDSSGITDGVVSASGITWSGGTLRQTLESAVADVLNGRALTMSVLLSDGTLYSGSGAYSKGTTLTFASNSTCRLRINSNNNPRVETTLYQEATVVAAKLELGTMQTLARKDASGSWALSEVPDYREQLLRCMRYFFRLKNNRDGEQLLMGGMARSATQITSVIQLPVPMRVSPDISVSSLEHFLYSKGQFSAGTPCTGCVGYYGMAPHNSRGVTFNGTDLTVGDFYNIYMATGGYIDFSADL